MLILSSLLRITSSLDDILKVRRLYSLLCYYHSSDDKTCVKCLSRKNRQNSTTQLRETLFLLSFTLSERKKDYGLVRLVESRPRSLQESLSLNSADLAGLNSISKVWFDVFWWQTGVCGLQRSPCGPLFCPSTLGMWEVGGSEERIRIRYFSAGSLLPTIFLHEGESSIGMQTTSHDSKLNWLN